MLQALGKVMDSIPICKTLSLFKCSGGKANALLTSESTNDVTDMSSSDRCPSIRMNRPALSTPSSCLS